MRVGLLFRVGFVTAVTVVFGVQGGGLPTGINASGRRVNEFGVSLGETPLQTKPQCRW